MEWAAVSVSCALTQTKTSDAGARTSGSRSTTRPWASRRRESWRISDRARTRTVWPARASRTERSVPSAPAPTIPSVSPITVHYTPNAYEARFARRHLRLRQYAGRDRSRAPIEADRLRRRCGRSGCRADDAPLERVGLVPREQGLAFIDRFLAIRESNRARADESGDEIPAVVSLRETCRDLGCREPGDDEAREALTHFFGPEEEQLRKIPGVDATLAALRDRGIRMALLSNATDGDVIRRVVHRCGWESLFDPLVVSTDVSVRKPRAEAFRAVLCAWPFEPSEVSMVGDSLRHDVDGGNRLGLRTIHFTAIPNPLDPHYAGVVVPGATVSSHPALTRLLLEEAAPD